MALVLERPRKTQPRAATGAPGAVVAALGSAWGRDLALGGHTVVSGTVGVSSYAGVGVRNPRATVAKPALGTEYTLVFVGQGGTAASNCNLIGCDDGGSNRYFQFRLDSTSGRFQFIRFTNSGSQPVSTSTSISLTAPYVVVGVTSGLSMSIAAANLGGPPTRATLAMAGVTPTSNPGTFAVYLGARDATVANPYDGDLFGAVILPFPVSLAQERAILENPWQLFAPRRIWVPQAAATGPSTQNLTPDLLTNTSSFYAPTVTPGAVTVSPDRLDNAQTFHAPTVSATYSITPDRLDNAQTFYAPTVSVGAVTLTPGRVDNVNEFFAPTVSQGGQIIAPDLLSNAQSFYAPTVTPGAVTLTPGLLTNTQTFYAPRVFDPAAVSTSLSGVYFDVLSGRLLVLRSGT